MTKPLLKLAKFLFWIVLLCTFALINQVQHWGLPDFGIHRLWSAAETIPCTYGNPGSSSTGSPGSTTVAATDPASASAVQPARALSVDPAAQQVMADLPASVASVQGTALSRLSSKPPSNEAIGAAMLGAWDAASQYVKTLHATSRGKPVPADVRAKQTRAVVAQQAALEVLTQQCANPCHADNPNRTVADTSAYASAGRGPSIARAAAARAGFTGGDLDIAVAVAGAESSWRSDAINRNANGSTDYGMWQINTVHAGLLAAGNWRTPDDNARMAFAVWSQAGRSWTPWTTFKTGAYRQHLYAAHTATTTTAAVGSVGSVGTQSVDAPMTCVLYETSGDSDGISGGAGAWGGYRNGRIPAVVLCHPRSAPAQLVRCDAARALDAMSAAYRASSVSGGRDLAVTDSYRSYAAQVSTKARKGNLAATPGTSNHGWGLAIDFGGGIQTTGSTAHAWMLTHAGHYGWVHPAWARPGGSKPEPWHWEYVGTTSTSATSSGRTA
ncbi:D-alanyl-D-alanine carboxypeptidase family protein [Angustibacter aerolatus]